MDSVHERRKGHASQFSIDKSDAVGSFGAGDAVELEDTLNDRFRNVTKDSFTRFDDLFDFSFSPSI